MCQLSHVDIECEVDDGVLIIEPFDPGLLRPNSYDWRLGHVIFEALPQFNTFKPYILKDGETFLFLAHHYYLCSTLERIILPKNISAKMEGRSSLGRLFVSVHQTAGHVDVGFSGFLTAEVHLGLWDVPLTVGQNVGQIIFEYVRTPAVVGYADLPGSKYINQPATPTPSRLKWEGVHDVLVPKLVLEN
jgi:dCTP deaminase